MNRYAYPRVGADAAPSPPKSSNTLRQLVLVLALTSPAWIALFLLPEKRSS